MKVTSERLEDCQVKLFVELDAADVDKKLRQTARTLSRQFTVPGYRKGKAPFHAVIRVFGREAVQQQTLEDFGNELYEQALEESEFEPYEVGELEDVEWDPFRMTILIPIQPEVELGDYRSVRVPYEPEEVTDERIDEYLEGLQEQYAQWVPVERPAQIGDQVVLDFQGTADGELFMDNEEEELILEQDSSSPLEGFHNEIVGLSAGEEKLFSLPVPEDDDDDTAAGKEGTITVKLHSVKEKDLPSIDDELAMMIGDYDTLDDLKAATRENMETEALQRAEAEYLDKVLDTMIENAVKIEYPSQAIDREADVALSQMERNLASSGIQLDTYLGMIGKTREMYRQELRPAAEERLKKRLVMAEVTKHEGLTVDDEQIEAEIDRICEMMGEQADDMRQMLETPAGTLSVMDDLISFQVQERIALIAKGEAPPLEEEEEEEAATKEEAEETTEEPSDEPVTEPTDDTEPSTEAVPAEAIEETPEPEAPVDQEKEENGKEPESD